MKILPTTCHCTSTASDANHLRSPYGLRRVARHIASPDRGTSGNSLDPHLTAVETRAIPTTGASGAPEAISRSGMSKGRQAGGPLARPANEVPGSPCRIRTAVRRSVQSETQQTAPISVRRWIALLMAGAADFLCADAVVCRSKRTPGTTTSSSRRTTCACTSSLSIGATRRRVCGRRLPGDWDRRPLTCGTDEWRRSRSCRQHVVPAILALEASGYTVTQPAAAPSRKRST